MRNRKLFGILMISILMICLLTGCRDKDIFQDKYKTVANGNLTCYNLKNYLDENIPKFGSYSYYVGYSYPIGIESACDLEFKYSDYCIDMNDYENEETVYVRSNIDICRYSFLGEKGYTDKEVQEYKEVINKVSKETADACEMLIKMKEK